MKIKITHILYKGWGTLGFLRGNDYYNFRYNQQFSEYSKDKYKTEPPKFMLSEQFGQGLLGALIYVVPLLCPRPIPSLTVFPLIQEIKRLEIDLSNMKDKKETEEYYKLV